MSKRSVNKIFGLALGGGGARAAAHIGALIELERLGFVPDVLAGTSAGGLIAALIAYGLSGSEIKEFFKSFRLQMFTFSRNSDGVLGATGFEEALRALIGEPTFEDLEIPLSLVATNLVTKQEVILNRGDLISAILATTAYPVLFSPVHRQGLILVDGGLINNVPFDVVRANGATHVVAIDLSNADPYGESATQSSDVASWNLLERLQVRLTGQALWQVVTAVSDIIASRGVQAHLAVSSPDILLRPYIGNIGLFDLQENEKGIQAGAEAVQAAEAELLQLLETT